MNTIVVLDSKDNVATLLTEMEKGSQIELDKNRLFIKEDIPFGHKVAIADIPLEGNVYKYGEPIGRATKKIEAGSWVHDHNCESIRGVGSKND